MHLLRALGGPIFNLLGILVSVAVFVMTPTHPLVREWASWSAFGHGVLLIESLFPVPMVDGGTLLKWTLVTGGTAPDQADIIIRRVDQGAVIVAAIAGVVLLAMKLWLPGLACLGLSAVVLGVVTGKIRCSPRCHHRPGSQPRDAHRSQSKASIPLAFRVMYAGVTPVAPVNFQPTPGRVKLKEP